MNININLIKKQGDLYDLIVRDNKILEMYLREVSGPTELSFSIYDPKTNTVTEIEPETKKAAFVNIHVSYLPCNEIYYAVYTEREDTSVDIDILAYDLDEKESRFLCSFNETPDVLTGQKRVRIFILSKTQLLIQTEIVDIQGSANLMGNIIFSQALYDTETDIPIEIIEENLNNNGINAIVPLNESEIMIKTGFSFLEDSRLAYGSENDALIESVYTTSIAKFTADIALKLTNIDMNLLTSTYFEKYILKPEVKDDFILYTVVNVEERESECIFYNYLTGEKIIGKNNDIDLQDLRVAYVINNTPYVRKYIENSCEFVNLLTAENDISFYEEDFVDVCGNMFVTYRRHGKRNHLRMYKYPHMDLVLEEKCDYYAGITIDNDYFIYTER